jgi:hypothetical protein
MTQCGRLAGIVDATFTTFEELVGCTAELNTSAAYSGD